MEDPCKRSLIGIEAMRTLLLAFCTILGQLAPEQRCVPGQLIARRALPPAMAALRARSAVVRYAHELRRCQRVHSFTQRPAEIGVPSPAIIR